MLMKFRKFRALFSGKSKVYLFFQYHGERLVDKGVCISFRRKKFETRPALIGYTVGIAYDPMVPEILTVSYHGMEPFTAHPLKIGAFCDKNPSLPVSMQPKEAGFSRLLEALGRLAYATDR